MIYSEIIDKITSNNTEILNKGRTQLIFQVAEKIRHTDNNTLVFICTHNSRRSQFAQAWATILNEYYDLPYQIYSAGTEKTTVHQNVISVLESEGMKSEKLDNGRAQLFYGENTSTTLYSKQLEEINENFIAIMVCDDADKNCPVIPEAQARFNLSYRDPGKYDGTAQVLERYQECSDIILSELNLLFKKLSIS